MKFLSCICLASLVGVSVQGLDEGSLDAGNGAIDFINYKVFDDNRIEIEIQGTANDWIAVGLRQGSSTMGGGSAVFGCPDCSAVNEIRVGNLAANFVSEVFDNDSQVQNAVTSKVGEKINLKFTTTSDFLGQRDVVGSHIIWAISRTESLSTRHRARGSIKSTVFTSQIVETSNPTKNPTSNPTTSPTTPSPSKSPTIVPTRSPLGNGETRNPTSTPTISPSRGPTTGTPTGSPTVSPTASPIAETSTPSTSPTSSPVTSEVKPDFIATETVMGGRGKFSWNIVEIDSRRMLQEDGEDENLITAQLEVDQSSGWIGFGVSSDGTMPSTHAVVGFYPASGVGALVSEYKLKDYNGFGDKINDSTMKDVSLVREGNKLILTATFSDIAGKKINVEGKDTLIFASNAQSSNQEKHNENPSVSSISWSDGQSENLNNPERTRKMFIAHGSLMITAFCFLYPLGMVPSVFRDKISGEGTWFLGHRILQVLGVLCTIVAFALAVSENVGDHFNTPHTALGLMLFLISIFQPFFAIFFRKGKTRPAWRASHFLFAAFLLLGGLANSYIGTVDLSLGYIGSSAKDSLEIYLYIGFAVTIIVALLVTWNRIKIAMAPLTEEKEKKKEKENTAHETEKIEVDLGDMEDQQNALNEQAQQFFNQYDEKAKNDDVQDVQLS